MKTCTTLSVIFIGPHVGTNHQCWPLQAVGQRTVIENLLDQLRTEAASFSDGLAIVSAGGQAPWVLEELRRVASHAGVQCFASSKNSRFGALSEAVAALGDPEAVVVFDGDFFLVGFEATRSLVRAHQERRADFTYLRSPRRGLTPWIVSSSSIRTVASLGLPEDLLQEFAPTFERLHGFSAHSPSQSESGYKINGLEEGHLPGLPEAPSLPQSGAIDNVHSRLAAEAVLAERVGSFSERSASFKRHLIAAQAKADFRFPEIRVERGATPVLLTTAFGAFSGAEQCFFDLASRIDRRRFHPVVCLPVQGLLSRKCQDAGLDVIITSTQHSVFDPYHHRFFGALLDQLGIRLVHINGRAAPALLASAHHRGIPLVHHVRAFNGPALADVLKFSSGIIAVSEAIRNHLLGIDLDPAVIRTIHDGIDLEKVEAPLDSRAELRIKYGLGTTDFVAGMVARIAPEKQIERMIDAMAKLSPEIPGLRLVVAGEPMPQSMAYFRRLNEQIERLGLGSCIRFLGFIPRIQEFHSLCDVHVLCNPMEPFAHCILEAMATGVPVLAPDRGGHTEIIRNGETGFLWNTARTDTLAEQLRLIHFDSRSSSRCAESARRVVRDLSLDRHVERVENFYRELIDVSQ